MPLVTHAAKLLPLWGSLYATTSVRTRFSMGSSRFTSWLFDQARGHPARCVILKHAGSECGAEDASANAMRGGPDAAARMLDG